MTLAGRTSVFFLGVLALVLVGFTAALYGLARSELHRQVDERLEAALAAMTAAIEVKPEQLEWEPDGSQIPLGVSDGVEQVRWVIRNGEGRPVGMSENLKDPARAGLLQALCESDYPDPLDSVAGTFTAQDGHAWRTRTRCLQAKGARPTFVSGMRLGKDGEREYVAATLVLTSGLSLHPVEQTLRSLLLTSIGLSAGLWLLAAFLGHWLCRRALAPLTQMAATARAMPATELHQRLPRPGTRDELEELATAFNDLLARVQDAFARQQQFTGEASHQLRTPLTALLGQVEVALRRDRSPNEYRRVLDRVQRQGQQLVRLVEMLLFLARADAEAGLPDLEVIDLDSWLPEYLAQRSDDPRAADIILEPLPAAPLLVRAHSALLGQLLDNLLENACKYSVLGSSVTVRAGVQADRVWLEVADRGMGMSPGDLAHVFEPFFRSAEVRHRGLAGAGLGLAVVQRIAAALGGVVRVRSESGVGSAFTLELPAGVSAESVRADAMVV